MHNMRMREQMRPPGDQAAAPPPLGPSTVRGAPVSATCASVTIEFSAKAVLIQGFYGLESALPRDRSSSERAMPLPDLTTPAPTEVDSSSDDDMMLDLIEEDDSE